MLSTTPVKPQQKEDVSIFCLQFVYKFNDGTTEYSDSKYCGNSPEHCYEAISKLLSACKSVLPGSIKEVSFNIQGYRRSTYESCGSPDYLNTGVVSLVLRDNNESSCKE